MIRRPPRSTLSSSSAASDVYKRQLKRGGAAGGQIGFQRCGTCPSRDNPKGDQWNCARPPFAAPPEKSVHTMSRGAWCPVSEVRELSRHPLTRTSEAKRAPATL